MISTRSLHAFTQHWWLWVAVALLATINTAMIQTFLSMILFAVSWVAAFRSIDLQNELDDTREALDYYEEDEEDEEDDIPPRALDTIPDNRKD